jgi:hypothetical protein
MKKMIVTLPGSEDYRGGIFRGGEYMKDLNARESIIYEQLQAAPTAIVRHGSEVYRETAAILSGRLNVTGDHLLLPNEKEFRELRQSYEYHLDPKLKWLSAEMDKLMEGNEGILMIASSGMANSFPSYYARNRGFSDPFVPFMGAGSSGIAVLDFDCGKIETFRYMDHF